MAINVSAPRPLERFFAHMGWPEEVRLHPDFPLYAFELSVNEQEGMVYVGFRDRRTGEIGALPDPKNEFPSATLVASFRMLVGPIDAIMDRYNKILNRRTRRRQPW
jgi:hypothetical protein